MNSSVICAALQVQILWKSSSWTENPALLGVVDVEVRKLPPGKIDLKLEIAPWKDELVFFGGPVQTERAQIAGQTASLTRAGAASSWR